MIYPIMEICGLLCGLSVIVYAVGVVWEYAKCSFQLSSDGKILILGYGRPAFEANGIFMAEFYEIG